MRICIDILKWHLDTIPHLIPSGGTTMVHLEPHFIGRPWCLNI